MRIRPDGSSRLYVDGGGQAEEEPEGEESEGRELVDDELEEEELDEEELDEEAAILSCCSVKYMASATPEAEGVLNTVERPGPRE